MDCDPQRVDTSPQDCPVCLCYALISTGHLLLPSSCRQGNRLDGSLVTAILLLSPSYEMRAGRIHTKICKLRFLNQAAGRVHKICFRCWFWMTLCSWDAAGAQFREALLSLQQPPQLSLPLWNANNSERIFSLESLLYQHFNVYLCCVSLCPKTRRGSAPLLVPVLVFVFSLLVDWSDSCSWLSLVPSCIMHKMLEKFGDQNRGQLDKNRTFITVSASHLVIKNDKSSSALSVQSSRKQEFKFGMCPVPMYKRNLHSKWRVESAETDFWRLESRKSFGRYSLKNNQSTCWSGQMVSNLGQ